MTALLAVLLVCAVGGLVAAIAALGASHRHAQDADLKLLITSTLLAAETLAEGASALAVRLTQLWAADAAEVLLLSPRDPSRCVVIAARAGSPATLEQRDVSTADAGALDLAAERNSFSLSASHDDARATRFAAARQITHGAVAGIRTGGSITALIALGTHNERRNHPLHSLDIAASQVGRLLDMPHLSAQHASLGADIADVVENHDPLTGLPNRASLGDHIAAALGERERTGHAMALLVAVLEGLAAPPEGTSRSLVDAGLKQCAQRMGGVLRRADTAARIGETTFAILFTDLLDDEQASAVARRLMRGLGKSVESGNLSLPLRPHIGLRYVDPGEDTSATAVLREAEAAATEARRTGRQVLAHSDVAAGRPSELLDDLRGALADGALSLNFQPIMALEDRAILGAEALVRWSHPTRGMVQPLEFLPLAEESGLAPALGDLVLRRACEQLATWQGRYPRTPPLAVSVNVAAEHLADAGFAERVIDTIHTAGVDPDTVILEFAEDVLLRDLPLATRLLDPLQRAGVHLAVDDVGTGHATLEYLRRLPVDILKIGRPFIEALVDDETERSTARAIVEQGDRLRMVLVAEGVENQIQVERLRQLGCSMAQGYFLMRPVDAAGMDAALAADASADPEEENSQAEPA